MAERWRMGADRHLPTTRCPHCRNELNGASSIHRQGDPDPQPEPGAFSVCASCSAVLRFGPNLELLEATLDDPALDEEDRQLIRYLQSLSAIARAATGKGRP